MESKDVNWEKVGIYFAVMASFITMVFYIADIKERIAVLETKMSVLIEEMRK